MLLVLGLYYMPYAEYLLENDTVNCLYIVMQIS